MDPFFNGTGKTGTGQVSFTRKNLSEPFHFLSEPFHFFCSCKRAFNQQDVHRCWYLDPVSVACSVEYPSSLVGRDNRTSTKLRSGHEALRNLHFHWPLKTSQLLFLGIRALFGSTSFPGAAPNSKGKSPGNEVVFGCHSSIVSLANQTTRSDNFVAPPRKSLVKCFICSAQQK